MKTRLLLTVTLAMIMGCAATVALSAEEGEHPERTEQAIDDVIAMLDYELEQRDHSITLRQNLIDSLRRELLGTPENYELMEQLGNAYSSFDNDSALAIYARALRVAEDSGNKLMTDKFTVLRAPLMPLGGFITEAMATYHGIDTVNLSRELLPLYFDAGRQMYSHIGAFYLTFPETRQSYERLSNESQHNLLGYLSPETPKYWLNAGEACLKMGELAMAKDYFTQIVDSVPISDNIYARAAHGLADISMIEGREYDHLYYLAMSAISDLRSVTLEVTSLQELGAQMYNQGDVERAYSYLSVALQNAVDCHAETRMLQTAMNIPLIESVHRAQLNASRSRMKLIIAAMGVLMVSLGVALALYYRQSRQQHRLMAHLEKANQIKDVYISQFLNLCSSYMDKLSQVCNIVTRKISAGKVDELLQLTQSGKFVENQTKEFYEVFDNAFLHIYPDFVEKVNELLQPEKRIVQRDKSSLNTDLRILAFMRMGIDDSGRIAELLNYSINTIYTYRNKLKNCAINRATFEADIRKL